MYLDNDALIDPQAQKRVFAEFEEEVRAIEESYELGKLIAKEAKIDNDII
jgi:hypothetical protein